jgi:dTDP-4-amino-4,6-dideoxygalactose transaminase
MSVPDTARHSAKSVVFEEYTELGYNCRMTDIQAAIGRVQLERLPQMLARRHQLAQRYFGLLSSVPGLGLPVEPGWARSNWQSFCVRLPEAADQKTVMQKMLDVGVETRRGTMCAHRERTYQTEPWLCAHRVQHQGSCDSLHNSERAQDETIVIPMFAELTDAEQEVVVRALQSACGRQTKTT